MLCLYKLLIVEHEQWRQVLVMGFDDLLVLVLFLRHAFAEHGALVLSFHPSALDYTHDLSLWPVVLHLFTIQKTGQLKPTAKLRHRQDRRQLEHSLFLNWLYLRHFFSLLGLFIEYDSDSSVVLAFFVHGIEQIKLLFGQGKAKFLKGFFD